MTDHISRFRRKKAAYKNTIKRYEKIYVRAKEQLDECVVSAHKAELGPDFPVEYQRLPWEQIRLEGELEIFAIWYDIHLEQNYITSGRLDKGIFSHCFNSFYYSFCISTRIMVMRPRRFPEAGWASRSLSDHFLLSMALLLEKEDALNNVYKMLKCSYEADAIIRSRSHICDFILLLIAKLKGENIVPSVDNFCYQGLLDNWDAKDEALINTLLTKLCDDQLQQVIAKPSDLYDEFDNGNWQFIPFAALTVLKLRANLGLNNPDIKHELFSAPVDQLLNIQEVDEVEEDRTLKATIDYLHELGFSLEPILDYC